MFKKKKPKYKKINVIDKNDNNEGHNLVCDEASLEMEKNVEDDNEDKILVCAAIDFGTTFSGLAYSYSTEKTVPHIQSKWPDGTDLKKVPTAVLFDQNNKLISFGVEAEEKYLDYIDEGRKEEFYYIKHFKMALYESKGIRKGMTLKAQNGKEVDAMEVFTSVIRFMKDHLITSIIDRGTIPSLNVDCVRWVVTVPAIWSHAGKVFMRKAAEQAGLPSRELVIALEPECASIYCNTAPKERMYLKADYKKSKCLVLDNGGGTIDITDHQIQDDGYIKEIYKANGGPWGGQQVDKKFEEYLEKLFSIPCIKEMKNNHQKRWLKVMKKFKEEKIKITNYEEDSMIKLPLGKAPWDVDHFNNVKNEFKVGSTIKTSKLFIKKSIVKEMIQEVAMHTANHVIELLKDESLRDLDVIMMVGGFSNSPILVNEIKKCVDQHKIPVVVPEEAQLAVLKGAVLFGWNQDKITCRRSMYTYLYYTTVLFVESKHEERHAFFQTRDGKKEKCCRILDKLVTVDDILPVDHVVNRNFTPSNDYQKEAILSLYASNKVNVLYKDDEGVEEIGSLTIPLSGVTRARDRSIDCEYYFGLTELKLVVTDKTTGEETIGKFDILV